MLQYLGRIDSRGGEFLMRIAVRNRKILRKPSSIGQKFRLSEKNGRAAHVTARWGTYGQQPGLLGGQSAGVLGEMAALTSMESKHNADLAR